MDGRDNNRPQPPLPTLFEATFANSATSPDDALLVTIEAFGELPFGDPDGVVWSPMGGALPQAGDRALVAESDDGSWWVVAWWSASQSDSSSLASGLAALEALGIAVDGDGHGFTIGSVHKRWGSVSFTVTASTVSATQTVAHGLGKTPTGVQLTLLGTAGFGAAQGVNLVAAPDGTNIQFQADFSVAASGTFTVYWDAAG